MSVKEDRAGWLKLEGLFAFWHYDEPPHVCGGEITRMTPKGLVETKEYGQGNFFLPFRILPATEGRKILSQLKEEERRVKDEEQSLQKDSRSRVNALFYGGLTNK